MTLKKILKTLLTIVAIVLLVLATMFFIDALVFYVSETNEYSTYKWIKESLEASDIAFLKSVGAALKVPTSWWGFVFRAIALVGLAFLFAPDTAVSFVTKVTERVTGFVTGFVGAVTTGVAAGIASGGSTGIVGLIVLGAGVLWFMNKKEKSGPSKRGSVTHHHHYSNKKSKLA